MGSVPKPDDWEIFKNYICEMYLSCERHRCQPPSTIRGLSLLSDTQGRIKFVPLVHAYVSQG